MDQAWDQTGLVANSSQDGVCICEGFRTGTPFGYLGNQMSGCCLCVRLKQKGVEDEVLKTLLGYPSVLTDYPQGKKIIKERFPEPKDCT